MIISEKEQEILDDKDAVYKWFELDKIGGLTIKPDCSKTILKNIPNQMIHMVNREW